MGKEKKELLKARCKWIKDDKGQSMKYRSVYRKSARESVVIRGVMNFPKKRIFRLTLKAIFHVTSAYFAIPFFFKISLRIYHNFFATSISFDLDTVFLNWNTTFPAITVCEIYNGETIWDKSEQRFGEEHDLHIDDFVGEIVFFRGTCTTCEKCESEMVCPTNFTDLLESFRSECSQLISNCSYTNATFDCCQEFRPIRTEHGICFAFNSNQARKMSTVQYANNRITGPGELRFDASADIQLHVHSPIEIPYIGHFSEGIISETVLVGSRKEIIVNVMEVYNHESVERLSIEERNCRFTHELTAWGRQLAIYGFYSFSSCIVECVLSIHLEHCNCTSHFLATTTENVAGRNAATTPITGTSEMVPMCDIQGLMCLTDYYDDMQEERKLCKCINSCEEPEYNIIFNSDDRKRTSDNELDNSHIRVSLVELPTQRFVRRLTKNNLDFIIAVGGIAGLFFNASLIRLVEVVFLVLQIRWQHHTLIIFRKIFKCYKKLIQMTIY